MCLDSISSSSIVVPTQFNRKMERERGERGGGNRKRKGANQKIDNDRNNASVRFRYSRASNDEHSTAK